jgi:uncharacterized protein (DUF427 family)
MSDLATWDVELPPPRVEASHRWVRVRAGDALVADSRRALLLSWYGPGMLPTYCLPAEDVRTDLLHPSADGEGPGFQVDHDVRAGDAVVTRAARLFRQPPDPLAVLDGYWTFTWDAGLSWF